MAEEKEENLLHKDLREGAAQLGPKAQAAVEELIAASAEVTSVLGDTQKRSAAFEREKAAAEKVRKFGLIPAVVAVTAGLATTVTAAMSAHSTAASNLAATSSPQTTSIRTIPAGYPAPITGDRTVYLNRPQSGPHR